MSHFGLTLNIINKINSVFNRYPEIDNVVIFGSRAKGNYRANSDIDLAIKGSHVSLSTLQQIEIELDELYIPNIIDLVIYGKIDNPELKDHIDRMGESFYKK